MAIETPISDQKIYVDIGGTFCSEIFQPINPGLAEVLSDVVEAGHEAVIFIDNLIKRARDKLLDRLHMIPENLRTENFLKDIASKSGLRGQTLFIVIDDTPREELMSVFGFNIVHYINAFNRREATFYREELEKILGPLIPMRHSVKESAPKSEIPHV